MNFANAAWGNGRSGPSKEDLYYLLNQGNFPDWINNLVSQRRLLSIQLIPADQSRIEFLFKR